MHNGGTCQRIQVKLFNFKQTYTIEHFLLLPIDASVFVEALSNALLATENRHMSIGSIP